MKIRTIYYTVSLFFMVLVISGAGSLIFLTSVMRKNTVLSRQAVESIRLSDELQLRFLEHNREAFLSDLAGHTENGELVKIEAEIKSVLAQLHQYVSSEAEGVVLGNVELATEQYLEKRQDLNKHRLSPDEKYIAGGVARSLAAEQARHLSDINLKQAEAAFERFTRQGRASNFLGMVVVGICLLGLPLFWWLTRQQLFHPLRELSGAIRSFRLTESPRPVKEAGAFELKQIAASFNDLARRLAGQRKMQLQFLAGVAHELRNPLAAVKMAADTFCGDMPVRGDGQEMIAIISRQTGHLTRLVEDLLEAGRIEAGHLELRREERDILSVVSDTVQLYSSASAKHNVKYVCKVKGRLICLCDGDRIGQVLNNLLGNAIKYSPEGGLIEVLVDKVGQHVVIEVTDEGVGILPEDRDKIFEPFHRTELTSKMAPGVGLGLSVSRRIVEGHGGTIHVRGGPSGKGSVFVVRLPVLAESAVARHIEL